MHILINISRSKANQAMKFGQLIEYNLRNIFREKSYTKCGGEAIHRPFSKRWKLFMSLDQYSKTLYNLFLMYAKLRTILKLNCGPLNFTSNKTFLKNKNRSWTSLSASFSAWFWRKIFPLLYFINWPNFIVWLPLLCETLGNMCICVIVC